MWSLAACGRSIADVMRSSNWSRDQMEAFQSRCLRNLVRHAFERVPYYRDLYRRHGLHPEDIRGIPDLKRIPVAERSEMQERAASDLIAAGYNPERLTVYRTSGSTGSPFSIRRTWFEERLLRVVSLRERFKLGLRLADVRAVVRITERPELSKLSARSFHARLGLLRMKAVNCLLPARDILSRLAEIQPDVLSGYPGTLAWISGEATAEDRRAIRPRFIFTGAETLTPEMRRQISECFGVPVYDFYAANEFNMIAYECRETGLYHVSEPSVIVEVLRDGEPAGPGESGEVVGTALHSYAMPFLRYRLGDVVTRGPFRCRCGATNATLQSIQGRTIERFPLPNGLTIHPYTLVEPLTLNSPWLRRYQIIQERTDRILIRAVPLPGQVPAADDFARVRAQMEKALGPGVAITFEVVSELASAESGKFRPYYSLVGSGS